MTLPRMLALLGLGLAASGSSLAAQAHPLTGRWSVEYQRGMRNENGELTPIMGTATLTLMQRGDSLVGTLAPTVGEQGMTSPAQAFAAKPGAGSATFVVKSQVRINMNGETLEKQATVTWVLSATGDTLSGTMERVIESTDFPSAPSPVKGTRLK